MKIPPEAHKELIGVAGTELPEQLVLAARDGPHAVAGIHAVGADELDLAHRAVADLLDQRLAGGGMAAHQAGGDLEVLLLRRLAGPENPLDAARIGREVLLHEHVDALLHGILEVRRAEGGVRGQHGHVARPQAVDRLAVGVEAQEPPLRRHVDLVAEQLGQGLVRSGPVDPGADRPWRPA